MLREGDIFYRRQNGQYFICKVLRLEQGGTPRMHLFIRGPVAERPLAEHFDNYPAHEPHSYQRARRRREVDYLGNQPIAPRELEAYLNYLKTVDYEAYLRERGQDPEAIHQRAGASLEQGMAAYREDDYTTALRHFNKALKLFPPLHIAHMGRGYCHLMLGDFERAWNDLKAAYRYFPQDEELGRLLIRIAMDNNLSELAESSLENLLGNKPNDPDLLAYQAYIHLDRMEYDRAWDLFMRARDQAGADQGTSFYHFACYHAARYERDAALEWLQLAFQKGYDEVTFLRKDPRLRSLHGTPAFKRLVSAFFPDSPAS